MWRSLLFVPVLEDRFLAKAAQRGADAIVLDLEASVIADRKQEAREAVPKAVARLAPDIAVTVRINPLWRAAIKDLEACAIPGVTALHIAQCESAEQIVAIDGILTELEAERGLESGAIRLIALIESAHALGKATEIAQASPRLCGMTIGVEDFATSMGVPASTTLLRPAVFQLNLAARGAGVHSFAVPAGMADFSDVALLETAALYARSLGSIGGYAVHPAQVAVLNKVFSATEEEIAWADKVIAAKDAAHAAKLGVFKVDGQMIDQPLIARAEQIIATRSKVRTTP